jgi:hypothetical protein
MAHTTAALRLLHPEDDTCLGRTCMKWSGDGELNRQDVALILQRLCREDAQVCEILEAAESPEAG